MRRKRATSLFSLGFAKEGVIEKRKTSVAKYVEAEASLFETRLCVRFLFHETAVVQASTIFRSKFSDPSTLLRTVYQSTRTLTKKRIKIAKISTFSVVCRAIIKNVLIRPIVRLPWSRRNERQRGRMPEATQEDFIAAERNLSPLSGSYLCWKRSAIQLAYVEAAFIEA